MEVLGQRLPLLEGSAASGPVTALVRPESVRLGGAQGAEGHVLAVSFLGSLCRVQIGLADGNVLAAQTAVSDATGLTPGDAIRVSVAPSPCSRSHASTSPRRPPDGASAQRSRRDRPPAMKRVPEPAREVDVIHETDVLVVGSGPGGLSAALAACAGRRDDDAPRPLSAASAGT